jgi:hypothetical protein
MSARMLDLAALPIQEEEVQALLEVAKLPLQGGRDAPTVSDMLDG